MARHEQGSTRTTARAPESHRRGASTAARRPLPTVSTAAAAPAPHRARRLHHPPLAGLFSVLLLAALTLLPALPAAAWTPATQQAIAAEGAALAPPDLARQIEKHPRAFRQGVADPFAAGDAARHSAAADGKLAETIVAEARRAVAMIEGHQPFEDVVRQLGVLAHYVADLNDPLAASDADPREGEYFADYARYLESAEPRLPLVFYGLLPGLERRGDLAPLVAAGVERGRELYPMVGREYRRIGFASGRGLFDDRSTAFGVGSLAFSHAVTDVAQALRWVWLQAGGGDPRGLPERGDVVLRLPRSAAGARPLPRLGR